jgi:hypothetical protein
MPQCICGEHFTTTSFDPYNKDSDICPKCRSNTTPRSYVTSYSWDCEGLTGMVLDINSSKKGEPNYE